MMLVKPLVRHLGERHAALAGLCCGVAGFLVFALAPTGGLFLVLDLTGATDVSTWASLTDGGFTPVGKTLLWQGVFGFSNFEAMTLGPQLTNGSQSLLLISDDGAGELAQRQDAFSLIITGLTTAL